MKHRIFPLSATTSVTVSMQMQLFFNDGSIERIAGEVTKIDKIQKRMTIENRIIAFNDLMEIEDNVY